MNEYLKEYLLILFWYIIPCFVLGLVVLFIRFVLKPKDYIYRKILHISAILTVFCFILPSHTWWIVALDILTILFLINITLFILERFELYKMLFVDKSHHEILRMINAYYLIMVILVLIFYGLRGEENKYLVIASILSWGLGDAMAAIVGIKFGKNKLNMNFVDENKTIEDEYEMVVQVNGKVRGKVSVSQEATNEEMETKAKEIPNVQAFTDGKEIVKVIVVPKKIVNIVVK